MGPPCKYFLPAQRRLTTMHTTHGQMQSQRPPPRAQQDKSSPVKTNLTTQSRRPPSRAQHRPMVQFRCFTQMVLEYRRRASRDHDPVQSAGQHGTVGWGGTTLSTPHSCNWGWLEASTAVVSCWPRLPRPRSQYHCGLTTGRQGVRPIRARRANELTLTAVSR